MLSFNRESSFFQDHSALVLQYEQTVKVISTREANASGPDGMLDKLKANLRAQEYSLLQKALENDGGNYRHPDVLHANYDEFMSKFGKEKRLFKLVETEVARKLAAFKEHAAVVGASLFQLIHGQALTKAALMQAGVDLNAFSAVKRDDRLGVNKYDSLLHFAARIGNTDAIKLLIEEGAEVDAYKPSHNFRDKRNYTTNTTPLGVAIAADNTRSARALLEAGAKIDMKEFHKSQQARSITSQIRSPDMRDLLIEHVQRQIHDAAHTSAESGLTFMEQVLIRENSELRAALDSVNQRLDAMFALMNPPGDQVVVYQGPGLFDQNVVDAAEPVVKRQRPNSLGID